MCNFFSFFFLCNKREAPVDFLVYFLFFCNFFFFFNKVSVVRAVVAGDCLVLKVFVLSSLHFGHQLAYKNTWQEGTYHWSSQKSLVAVCCLCLEAGHSEENEKYSVRKNEDLKTNTTKLQSVD